MRAEVVPRPTVERAFLHARYIVGYEIVTETISFIGRAPHCARCGLNAESHTVANARREQLAATLGARVEHHDRSTIGLTIPRSTHRVRSLPGGSFFHRFFGHVLANVAARADGNVHALAIGGKRKTARDVSARRLRCELRNDDSAVTPCLKVADAIAVAQYAIELGHIQPLRIVCRN